MKSAEEHKRRLKKLLSTVRNAGGKARPERIEDPLDALLLGILSRGASDSRAAAALVKIRAAMVDLNELRVTPVSDLVEIIGADYPMVRPVAMALSRSLISLFNRKHSLDLHWLRSAGIKQAESFLSGLDGVDPHARAVVLLRSLGAHTFPLDDLMFALLRQEGCIAKDSTVEAAQSFVERQIKHADLELYYGLLKHYAAVHAPRKPPHAKKLEPSEVVEPAAPEALPEPAGKASHPESRPKPKPDKSGAVKRPAPAGKRSGNKSHAPRAKARAKKALPGGSRKR